MNKNEQLLKISRSGVLPMILSKNGIENESILEVFICDAIGGGGSYINNMPNELTISRHFRNEGSISAKYLHYETVNILKRKLVKAQEKINALEEVLSSFLNEEKVVIEQEPSIHIPSDLTKTEKE